MTLVVIAIGVTLISVKDQETCNESWAKENLISYKKITSKACNEEHKQNCSLCGQGSCNPLTLVGEGYCLIVGAQYMNDTLQCREACLSSSITLDSTRLGCSLVLLIAGSLGVLVLVIQCIKDYNRKGYDLSGA
jgi:hypothetical protein